MKTRTQQIEELQKEWTQPRWEGITRPYSAEDVVKSRGSVNPECTLAQLGAAKMWRQRAFSSSKILITERCLILFRKQLSFAMLIGKFAGFLRT